MPEQEGATAVPGSLTTRRIVTPTQLEGGFLIRFGSGIVKSCPYKVIHELPNGNFEVGEPRVIGESFAYVGSRDANEPGSLTPEDERLGEVAFNAYSRFAYGDAHKDGDWSQTPGRFRQGWIAAIRAAVAETWLEAAKVADVHHEDPECNGGPECAMRIAAALRARAKP